MGIDSEHYSKNLPVKIFLVILGIILGVVILMNLIRKTRHVVLSITEMMKDLQRRIKKSVNRIQMDRKYKRVHDRVTKMQSDPDFIELINKYGVSDNLIS